MKNNSLHGKNLHGDAGDPLDHIRDLMGTGDSTDTVEVLGLKLTTIMATMVAMVAEERAHGYNRGRGGYGRYAQGTVLLGVR